MCVLANNIVMAYCAMQSLQLAKKEGEIKKMKAAPIIALLTASVALLLLPSTDAEGITEKKVEIGNALGEIEEEERGPVLDLVNKFTNHLAAAQPPAAEDVESASHIGGVVIPPPPEPAPAPPPPP